MKSFWGSHGRNLWSIVVFSSCKVLSFHACFEPGSSSNNECFITALKRIHNSLPNRIYVVTIPVFQFRTGIQARKGLKFRPTHPCKPSAPLLRRKILKILLNHKSSEYAGMKPFQTKNLVDTQACDPNAM